MVCGLRFEENDFLEEQIYWNKRGLEEKVGDKEQRYFFLSNLVFICSELKEYELVLEYGKKPMEWLDSVQKSLSDNYKLIQCMLAACKGLKRSQLGNLASNTRLKRDKKYRKCMNHMQQTSRQM